ncbi:UNVERIFIED_CONTAM: IQ domain-containing protein IQM6 [Sesamum angustifolium]|uniref:IQ domain-containing protein IQM6 n=1 Tax=Sesamum angustifolium TaxID=2727405 RepID=A0AAW2PTR1_9LAMI
MGVTFSIPFVDDLDDKLESYLVRSISFGSHNANDPQSVSFNGGDSKPASLKSFGSGKMILEGTLSFRGKELEAKISVLHPSPSNSEDHTMFPSFSFRSRNAPDKFPAADTAPEKNVQSPLPQSGSSRHLAALKLQKTYKSFRTRRQLADCAVLVEQRWWKLLDFAELKRSSISFFEIEKPETAVSRWSREEPGLLRWGKACRRTTRHVNLLCSIGSRLLIRDTGMVTTYNFIMPIGSSATVNSLFSTEEERHISTFKFLGWWATLSAGRLVVEDGVLKAVWPHSGHYLPTEENFEAFMAFLLEHNVDLSAVQRAPCNGEEEVVFGLRNSISVPDLRSDRKESNNKNEEDEKTDSSKKYCNDAENIHPPVSRWSRKLHSKIALLQIPRRGDALELFSTPKPGPLESPSDGYETADECLSDSEFSVSKQNLFNQDEEQEYEEPIPREKIMKRINSHKGMKSYQLANQLSCKWTTGAGPRIGCVRDYPSELQFRVMEEVCLSPRSTFSSPRGSSRSPTTATATTPTSSLRERSPLGTESPNAAEIVML